MFLGVVTNQEIMDVLQALNNKSIWEIALSVLTPVVASIITLWLSNKHSEKQLTMQFENERQKVREDKRLQLEAEEKFYIDKKTIENLTAVINELALCFRIDWYPQIKVLSRYYSAVENDDPEEIEKNRLEAINVLEKRGKELNQYTASCSRMLSYASKETREKFLKLSEEITNFDLIQRRYQLNYLKSKCTKTSNGRMGKAEIDNFNKNFCLEFSILIDNIEKELQEFIDEIKK